MARILVIEDHPANMKLACLLLRSAGHTVLCAVDAETGLTFARAEHQPDLILMDIQLPGMDGLAATALLKLDPATASIPVVALTAMAMKSDEEKIRVAGCDGYIAKPVRYQELYAVIDSLLECGDPNSLQAGMQTPITPAQSWLSGQHGTVASPAGHEGAQFKENLILVAEDNETNQKVILRQLALLGYSAHVAGNGRVALELWRRGKYALLLTDLRMPEMDGYELVEAIRLEEQGASHIPIVLMTASSSKRDGERLRTPDMDAVLDKPLQLDKLKAALEAWLPMTASSATPAFEGAHQPGAAVDVSVLAGLVGNDAAVLFEFLDDFRLTAAKIGLELKDACLRRDALSAGQRAHALMSAARSVGAVALGDLCREMERAGHAGDTEALEVLLPSFELELDAVNACLDTLQSQRAECRAVD